MYEIINFLKDKKIAILGFGREGKSSWRFVRKHLPNKLLTIHDKDFVNIDDANTKVIYGDNYLQNLNNYDIILKTPGISFAHLNYYIEPEKISSQTALFLQYYGKQTIGITGTKGKSTIASLINHILRKYNRNVVLAGNIGVPFFDIADKITQQTWVVAELSAHQLEFVQHSPHIAIWLNLYQEHLDHFNSFSSYGQAKLNITKYQNENDILVYNKDDEWITKFLFQHNFVRKFYPFSNDVKYKAARVTCGLLGIIDYKIEKAIASFIPLEHRQEFVGEKHGIRFYNDSIATVPEATIFALETLAEVNTLLLGGFDRGIDYTVLYDFLQKKPVENIVFMGPAGMRMKTEWKTTIHHIVENDMQKIIQFAIARTKKGKICLLSPAAASYDQYTNFEERGKLFKKWVLQPFSLKMFNSFKIEVVCHNFIWINKEEELKYLFEKKIFETPFLFLGGGCNTLFTKDFEGSIIYLNTKGIHIVNNADEYVDVEVKAGEDWEDFIDFCVQNSYYGVENLTGIPGKVGSCPIQNIGAYGVEVKDWIKEVNMIEITTGKPLVLSNADCKFGYRDSIFKKELKNKVLITSVLFRLSKKEKYILTYKALLEELKIQPKLTLPIVRDKVLEIRNKKLPNLMQTGSVGSFFKNPVIPKEKFNLWQEKFPSLIYFEEDENHVKLSAAQLIEISGLKGYREGDAGVYPSQPLVLVNYGDATGIEIKRLSEKIRDAVSNLFDLLLEYEVNII